MVLIAHVLLAKIVLETLRKYCQLKKWLTFVNQELSLELKLMFHKRNVLVKNLNAKRNIVSVITLV